MTIPRRQQAWTAVIAADGIGAKLAAIVDNPPLPGVHANYQALRRLQRAAEAPGAGRANCAWSPAASWKCRHS